MSSPQQELEAVVKANNEQAETVRKLKADGASKTEVNPTVLKASNLYPHAADALYGGSRGSLRLFDPD